MVTDLFKRNRNVKRGENEIETGSDYSENRLTAGKNPQDTSRGSFTTQKVRCRSCVSLEEFLKSETKPRIEHTIK